MFIYLLIFIYFIHLIYNAVAPRRHPPVDQWIRGYLFHKGLGCNGNLLLMSFVPLESCLTVFTQNRWYTAIVSSWQEGALGWARRHKGSPTGPKLGQNDAKMGSKMAPTWTPNRAKGGYRTRVPTNEFLGFILRSILVTILGSISGTVLVSIWRSQK